MPARARPLVFDRPVHLLGSGKTLSLDGVALYEVP
jgi:hypothetical protein